MDNKKTIAKPKYRPIPQDLLDAVYYNNGGVFWKEDVKVNGRWSPSMKKGRKATRIKPKYWESRRNYWSPARNIIWWYVDGKRTYFRSARVIMAMFRFDDIYKQIDHTDHNTLNDELSNLRYATSKENIDNRRTPRHNTTGFKNVRIAGRKKHLCRVIITVDGKDIQVKDKEGRGCWPNTKEGLEYADKVAKDFREKISGKFACHG